MQSSNSEGPQGHSFAHALAPDAPTFSHPAAAHADDMGWHCRPVAVCSSSLVGVVNVSQLRITLVLIENDSLNACMKLHVL